MIINKTAIYRHIGEFYKGNIARFCKDLELDYSGVWRVLNDKSNGTAKFIPALFNYCKKNSLNFDDFVS